MFLNAVNKDMDLTARPNPTCLNPEVKVKCGIEAFMHHSDKIAKELFDIGQMISRQEIVQACL